MLNLGWFSSGGAGSRYILEHVLLLKPNDIHIKWVFMNKDVDEDENAENYTDIVKSAGIPLLTLSWKSFTKYNGHTKEVVREMYDREIAEMLNFSNVDYVFMAGYMRIITKHLLKHKTFVNLHPGLPGGHKGTYHEVIEKLKTEAVNGFITTGSMTHFVDEGVDTGKPIMFFKFTCPPEYNTIRKHTLWGEPHLLLATMNHFNYPIEI
jgi:folate-dependent phosphoribosylglycinamide formyltransferase PurN